MHAISAPIVYQVEIEHAVMLCGGGEMAALTTHVLNTATGMPAAGMRIELAALDFENRRLPNVNVTNADGRCPAPLLQGDQFRVGRYSLTFHVADYFRSIEIALPEPPFLDQVVIAFGIADAGQNYHVPLLISPWSYSTYRGS
jgi:5-hydroxyisourate hydrolase